MYGIAYYAMTTAAPRIAADLGLDTADVFGLLSIGLLLSAVVSPAIGRWVDRAGAKRALIWGAAARACVIAGLAAAPEFWTFALLFVGAQMLGPLTEYDATFAAAAQVTGDEARLVMSHITLWGGFASTAFWPASAFLLDTVGWRPMFLIYALLMLAVCVPLAALLPARLPVTAPAPRVEGIAAHAGGIDGRFAMLALAFAFGAIAYNLPSILLPVLEGLGLGAAAILAGMVFGPAQTAARLCETLFGSRVRALTVAVLATAVLAISLAALLAAPGALWAALVFALLFGAGAGVSSVVRGSVVLELYGRDGYAARLGRLGSVRLLVTAATPFGLALALDRYGAESVVALCLVATLASLAFFAALHRAKTSRR
ncbi:MAG: MFS transporter [Azospirillum sp.]|nr:MFS transporter [Azospirillum sp.]